MDDQGRQRAWEAIEHSMALSKTGDMQKALQILDTFLDEASRKNWSESVKLVSGTAAVMADTVGDLQRARHYYERSLAFVPDDPQALYGLARTLSREGQAELAEQYAKRSFELSTKRGAELDSGLIELIIKQWPEVDRDDG